MESNSSVKIKSEWGEKEIKEEKMIEREEIRKNALDPMNGIMKTAIRTSKSTVIGSEKFDGEIVKIKEEPRESSTQFSPPVTQSSSSPKNNDCGRNSIGRRSSHDNVNRGNKSSSGGASTLSCHDSSSNGNHIDSNHLHKKTSHSNRERKRQRTRDYSDNESRSSDSGNRGSSSSNGSRVCGSQSKVVSDRYETKISDGQCTFDSNANSSIALLRLKRIERENVERKRAALLLAKLDIYGPPLNVTCVGNLPDGREQRYHQQFHPHIAR